MAYNLVIVESPAKAKTIGKILGHNFKVMASIGHIRDLPEQSLGVDVEHNFELTYVIPASKKKIVSDLRAAAKGADSIYLAPDPDREGEAIAWHLYETLRASAPNAKFLRVQYNEITPRAVKAAFENPGEINMSRVDAQQSRRVIDRIVGYKVSEELWRWLNRRGGLSAGRVQSVALRLACEREREIQAFVPEKFWLIGALLRKNDAGIDTTFKANLRRIDGKKAEIKSEEEAKAILADLDGRALKVAAIKTRTIARRPLPPFITSTLQAAGSSRFGMSPSRTMSIAQKLYEGITIGDGAPVGLITYMRTDAPNISIDARNAAKDFIVSNYGYEFYPEKPNVYRSRANAQEAHEAIRPTDVNRTPESVAAYLSAQELKLYDLIWRRFVASQMREARVEQRTAEVISCPPPAQNHSYTFTASAAEIVFPGFLKVMELDVKRGLDKEEKEDYEAEPSDEETDAVEALPKLVEGENVDLVKWLNAERQTKPPARFSESALIKTLEANGVGRPSTYASIIETLANRKYVERANRTLTPTELGFRVSDILVDKLPNLFDVGFTASMESQLDEVEDGGIEWRGLMSDFYGKFTEWMGVARAVKVDAETIRKVVEEAKKITTWHAPTTIGRRTYSDEEFFSSVLTRMLDGNSITERQFSALTKMLVRYEDQLPGIVSTLKLLGCAPESPRERPLATPEEQVATRAKLAALLELPLAAKQKTFVQSIDSQNSAGRSLSEAQLRAIDGMLRRFKDQIPNFASLGVPEEAPTSAPKSDSATPKPGDPEPPTEAEATLAIEALKTIKKWNAPVKRGFRTFDDSVFAKSVLTQFRTKNALSGKQFAAVKKLIGRYHEQIANFEQCRDELGITIPPPRGRKPGSKNKPKEQE